jgi:folate-binding protein YgfZ
MLRSVENLLLAAPIDLSRPWLLDSLPWKVLAVQGSERATWLHGLITCDVRGAVPGEARWGLVLDRHGKIIGELCLVVEADRLLLLLNERCAEPVRAHLERHLIVEDVTLCPMPQQLVWVFGGGGAGAVATEPPAGALPWRGPTARLWFLLPGAPQAERAAISASAAELQLVCSDDWPVLRIALGLAEFGSDFNAAHTPHDASLERRAVRWDAGCYLGQEVVCMQDMRGKARWRLVSASVQAGSEEEGGVLGPGAILLLPEGGQEVGSVTSVARVSPEEIRLLVRVRPPQAAPGTLLLAQGHRVLLLPDAD